MARICDSNHYETKDTCNLPRLLVFLKGLHNARDYVISVETHDKSKGKIIFMLESYTYSFHYKGNPYPSTKNIILVWDKAINIQKFVRDGENTKIGWKPTYNRI